MIQKGEEMAVNPIDTFSETVISLDDAAKHVSKISGKKRNRALIIRWANRGVSGVRLKTICIGSEIFTSREAINAFLNESRNAKQAKLSKATSQGIRSARSTIEQEALELGI